MGKKNQGSEARRRKPNIQSIDTQKSETIQIQSHPRATENVSAKGHCAGTTPRTRQGRAIARRNSKMGEICTQSPLKEWQLAKKFRSAKQRSPPLAISSP